jgi:hypothetical protein
MLFGRVIELPRRRLGIEERLLLRHGGGLRVEGLVLTV